MLPCYREPSRCRLSEDGSTDGLMVIIPVGSMLVQWIKWSLTSSSQFSLGRDNVTPSWHWLEYWVSRALPVWGNPRTFFFRFKIFPEGIKTTMHHSIDVCIFPISMVLSVYSTHMREISLQTAISIFIISLILVPQGCLPLPCPILRVMWCMPYVVQLQK